MNLKFETKEFKVVDYLEIEKLFEEIYGTPFNVCETLNVGNDCYAEFEVKKGIVDPEELSWALDELKNIDEPTSLIIYDVLVTDAANKELIPEGEYLVKISW